MIEENAARKEAKRTTQSRSAPLDRTSWPESVPDSDGSEGFQRVLVFLTIIAWVGIFGIFIPSVTLIHPAGSIGLVLVELIFGGVSFLVGAAFPAALLVLFVYHLIRCILRGEVVISINDKSIWPQK